MDQHAETEEKESLLDNKKQSNNSFAKTADSNRLRKGIVQPIGIIYFVDNVADQAIVFDDETPNGRTVTDPSTLASDTRYVSNILYNDFVKDSVWRALHDGIANESHFRIRLTGLIKELGGNPNNTEHWKALAPTIRTGLVEALKLVGYDYRERNPWEGLSKALTKGWGSTKPSFPSDVAGDLASTGSTAWVSVHSVRSAARKTFINLQADRYKIGHFLLQAKVPVGDWVRHEVDAEDEVSIRDLLNLRSEHQDFVARVRVTDRISGDAEGAVRLPSVEETGQPRMYLTGPELAAMDKGIQDFNILHYYIGPIKALTNPLPIPENQTFHGSLAMELAVRSRKIHPAFGFWISILERLWIYERVRELSIMEDVEINGFGSGKINVKIPADTYSNEEALKTLTRFGMRHHLLTPVPLSTTGAAIADLLEICSDSPLKSAIIGAPALLSLFDEAIKSNNEDKMDAAATKISDVICERIESGLDDIED